MKLQQACAAYGLLARPSLVDQVIGYRPDNDRDAWMSQVWPRDPQFDQLFELLNRCGQVDRRFVLSGMYSQSFAHGQERTDIADALVYVYGVKPALHDQPTSATNRPSLYHESQRLVAALRFNLPDPLGTLITQLEQLLVTR